MSGMKQNSNFEDRRFSHNFMLHHIIVIVFKSKGLLPMVWAWQPKICIVNRTLTALRCSGIHQSSPRHELEDNGEFACFKRPHDQNL